MPQSKKRRPRRAPPPSAFISYSRDSTEHREWVATLAARLRQDGVSTILDQYVSSPDEGWPRWTQNSIYQSDFVLLVCTKAYRERFEGRVTDGAGKGVTWEGLIANQILYDSYCRNKGFIAITRNPDHAPELIPLPFRGFRHFTIPVEYNDLLQHIKLSWARRSHKNFRSTRSNLDTLPSLKVLEVSSSGPSDQVVVFDDPESIDDVSDLYFASELRAPFDGVAFDCCVVCSRPSAASGSYWIYAAYHDKPLKSGADHFDRLEPFLVFIHSEQNESFCYVAQSKLIARRVTKNGYRYAKGDKLADVLVPKWNQAHPPWTLARDVIYEGVLKYAPNIRNSSWHRNSGRPTQGFDILKSEMSRDGSYDMILKIETIPGPDGRFLVPAPMDGALTFELGHSPQQDEKMLIGKRFGGEQVVFRIRGSNFTMGVKIDAVEAVIESVPAKSLSWIRISQPVIGVKTSKFCVRSPMVGTFYSASEPNAEPFVRRGTNVLKGDTLFILEAIKAMNQIPSPVNGRIVEIMCIDGQPMEFGEPIMILETA